MVDLVVLPLLVSCNLPLWLLHQVAHPANLRALSHSILHRLGQSQSGLPNPLVEPSVDCGTNTSIRDGMLCWVISAGQVVGDVLTSHIVNVELLPSLLLV